MEFFIYTGCRDKNGTPILVGDKIKAKTYGVEICGEVTETDCNFFVSVNNGSSMVDFGSFSKKELEVVKNGI